MQIGENTKVLLAQYGPNKLFGDNIDDRKKLSRSASVALFDQVWRSVLEQEVLAADRCISDDAFVRLTISQQRYFDHDQEHRSFRIQSLNSEYVVQLQPIDGEGYELTQLWRVSSSDTHPKTLFINFQSVEDREKFRNLARNLGLNDEELGFQLVMNFMEKHPSRFLEDHL